VDEIRLIEVKEGILAESQAMANRLRERLRSTYLRNGCGYWIHTRCSGHGFEGWHRELVP